MLIHPPAISFSVLKPCSLFFPVANLRVSLLTLRLSLIFNFSFSIPSPRP
jgi:hypothetical protein